MKKNSITNNPDHYELVKEAAKDRIPPFGRPARMIDVKDLRERNIQKRKRLQIR